MIFRLTRRLLSCAVLALAVLALALSVCARSPVLAQDDTLIQQQELPPAGQVFQEPEQDPAAPPEAQGTRIENRVAVFSGLDKITGRITRFDVYIDETVQFGALQVTPRVCYSRDVTEAPKTTTFVEVDEITLDRKIRRIFNGWMFADSPGLSAVDHPVYDVWLTDCKMESDIPPPDTETVN